MSPDTPTPARVFLRPIGPGDLDILEAWENDPEVWAATDFEGRTGNGAQAWAADERPPYSLAALRQFIDNQQLGIDRNGQLRLVICLAAHDDVSAGSPSPLRPGPHERTEPQCAPDHSAAHDHVFAGSPSPRRLGFVDLFDYDSRTRTAEVGLLIYLPADRGRGYGSRALALACGYAFGELGMSELRCAVAVENFASRRVFEKCGFIFEENRTRLGNAKMNFALPSPFTVFAKDGTRCGKLRAR